MLNHIDVMTVSSQYTNERAHASCTADPLAKQGLQPLCLVLMEGGAHRACTVLRPETRTDVIGMVFLSRVGGS